MSDKPKPDFVEIATPLIERGFRVTPVHPETKCGVMKNWTQWQLKTAQEVQEFIRKNPKYTNYNVGVVSKRGVGREMFLDIDAYGVVQRIEGQTTHMMPKTYTVCSRPSTPFKRHYYMLQTAYSFQMFAQFAKSGKPWDSVKLNVKDLNEWTQGKSGRIHPTLYDVKGIGKGDLVVAAGSVRESGEIYTCIDDSPIAQIPDWLVDWLCADVTEYLKAKDEENARKFADRTAAVRLKAEEREKMRVNGDADGFDIFEEDTYDFLRSRAGSLVKLGFDSEDLLTANLTYQARKFCQNAEVFIASQAIQKIAAEAIGWPPGNATWFYEKRFASKTRPKSGLVIPGPRRSKREVIHAVIQTFRNQITQKEAIQRVKQALRDAGLEYKQTDRRTICEARAQAGFKVTDSFWISNGLSKV